MQPLFIKNRYRVTRALKVGEDHAALLAVDIEDRDNARVLVNVYEGDSRKRYAGVFTSLSGVAEYRGLAVDGDSLCGFFEYNDGPTIDDVFFRGSAQDWQTRLYYAGLLFHLALRLSQAPPEVGCAAFISENLIVRTEEERLLVNYVISPAEYASEREMLFLLTDQILKILPKRWESAPKEVELTSVLAVSEFPSAAALYSYWLEYEKAIRAQYQAIYKKSTFHRFFYCLFQNIRRAFRRKGR